MAENQELVIKETVMEYKSPFHEFVSLLERRYVDTAVAGLHGAITWMEFPVEEALADGVYLVMNNIAGQMGTTLTTAAKIDEVSGLVERIISSGLTLMYGPRIDRAVHDFEMEVVRPVHRALDLGLRPGMKLSAQAWKMLIAGQDTLAKNEIKRNKSVDGEVQGDAYLIWQMPAAIFWSKLIKVSRKYLDRFDEMLAELHEFETDRSGRLALVDIDGRGYLNRYFDRIRVEVDDNIFAKRWSSVLAEFSYSEHLQFWPEWRRLLTSVRLNLMFRNLTIDISKCEIDRISLDRMTVEEHWINTQILLVAVKAEARLDVCTIEQYETALAVIRNDADSVLQQAKERIEKRLNFSLSVSDQLVLAGHVSWQIGFVSRWSNLSELQVLPEFIYAGNWVDAIVRNHEMAKNVFLGATVPGEKVRESAAAVTKRLTTIQQAVQWDQITIKEWREMVDNIHLPGDVLAANISKLAADIRQEAFEYFSLRAEETGKVFDLLIEQGLIKVDWGLIQRQRRILNVRHWSEFLRHNLVGVLNDFHYDDVPLILGGLNDWSAEELSKVLNGVKIRELWVGSLYEIINGSFSTAAGQRMIELLRTKVGQDIWNRWILAYCLMNRLQDFEELAVSRDDEYRVPRWEEAYTKIPFSFSARDVFGLNLKEVKKLFTDETESEIIGWLYEDDIKIQKKYRRRSRQYFKKLTK